MTDLINVTETVRRIAPLIRDHFDQPDFDQAIFAVLPQDAEGMKAQTILVALPHKTPEPDRLVLLNDDGHLALARWPHVRDLPLWATVIATISRP
jgi:hypothetical protein